MQESNTNKGLSSNIKVGFLGLYSAVPLPLDQSSGRGRPSCAGSSCSSPPGQRGARAVLRMVQQVLL